MIAEFIDPLDPCWKRFLSVTKHDSYHLPEYVEVAAAEDRAVPMAFYAEHGGAACLIPLLLRPISAVLNGSTERFDCTSPYGYSGILASSHERLHSFVDVFCRTARTRGLVTAFLRLHPLFPLDHGVLGKFGKLVRHGRTVYIDLSDSEEHIVRRVSTNHRRNIQKLARAGFRTTLDEWDRYKEFIAIYSATMERVGAAKAYFFSMRYFEALRERLGADVHLVCVLSSENELAAAGLFTATDGIVQYHLGGTAARYLSVAPSKLMMDYVWRWAKAHSYRVFHLGGGVGGAEDSLFEFKAQFSPARGEFYTYRVVVDEEKNTSLNQAWESMRGTHLAASLEFFPVYRSV